MHTFGNPCRVDEIKAICDEYHICLIEDAAESLGSLYKGKHTGTYGEMGVMSFNGNKIITAGGGGCIITDNETLAKQAKHLTTTAKVSHKWAFNHDQVGYNYRMPNLNAALLVAQLEQLDSFLNSKRKLAIQYKEFFVNKGVGFVTGIEGAKSNYWLNVLMLDNLEQRDLFLEVTNAAGVMTRPIWTLMSKLPMFKDCQKGNLSNAEWLEDRAVNIPSSVI
jgi:dTDP-4-amino-4,6-dideoxygalactose transaminase